MKFGVVPLGGAGEMTLQVSGVRPQDDFPNGFRVDTGASDEGWPLADCEEVRRLPITNVRNPLDNTGVVFRHGILGIDTLPQHRRHSDRTLLMATLASTAVGAALALLLLKDRK